MIAAPFRASRQEMDEASMRTHQARGIVRLGADYLELEFREHVQEYGFESYRERVEELHTATIPLDHLTTIEWRNPLGVQPRIVLGFSRLSSAARLPWVSETRAVLAVRWRDRHRGRELAGEAALLLADRQLRQAEAEPPPLPPARDDARERNG